MRSVTLKNGSTVPVLGLGTWRMGERASERAAEVAALKLGLELGIRLIDTAEMYGEGKAEEIVADAVAGRRDEIFIVSKRWSRSCVRYHDQSCDCNRRRNCNGVPRERTG
jgi:diketogulonate reductase-like aldo/keto reductase